MRLLMLHVDYFKPRVTEKGRSTIVEPVTNPVTEANDAIVVLTSVEKDDEGAPEIVSQRAVDEIGSLATKLKVKGIVLHPFAHLFGEPSSPKVAISKLKRCGSFSPSGDSILKECLSAGLTLSSSELKVIPFQESQG